jgi:acyl carrier protein
VNDHDLRVAVTAVLAQIAPEAAVDSLPGDVDLREELDIDSMDFLNFVVGIADTTGADIPERDYAQLATLDGCVAYLRSRAGTGGSP